MEFIGVQTIDDLVRKYSMNNQDLSKHFFDNISTKKMERRRLVDRTLLSLDLKGESRSPQEETLYEQLLKEQKTVQKEKHVASEGINDMVASIENDYDNIVQAIRDVEKEYFNTLKQQEIGKIEDMKVVLVDGDVVEKKIDMDFVEGSNPSADVYVPKKTLWIDSNLDSNSFKYIILHEFIENELMQKNKIDYASAHEIANQFEKRFREETEK